MNTIIEKIRAEIKGITETARNTRINGTTQQAKEADSIIHALDNLMLKISDLEKEEKSRRVRTLEEEFDGYNPIVVTLDKYVLEGIGVGRHCKVIIKIQRKED